MKSPKCLKGPNFEVKNPPPRTPPPPPPPLSKADYPPPPGGDLAISVRPSGQKMVSGSWVFGGGSKWGFFGVFGVFRHFCRKSPKSPKIPILDPSPNPGIPETRFFEIGWGNAKILKFRKF